MEYDQSANEMESGKAEYIMRELKTQIEEGNLAEQKKLPSERELSQKYKVSRMTARRALQLLEGEGFVTRHPVRGTFVGGIRERLHEHHGSENFAETGFTPVVAEELRQAGSFIKEMERLGLKPEVDWIEPQALVPADYDIAEHLQVPEDSLVLKRYRLQLADGLPYRLIKSYYPADLFGELLKVDIGDKPLFKWLEEQYDLRAAYVREELIARLATTEERRLLQISPNAPVVAFNRLVCANSDRRIEWATIIAVASLYTFSYEYDIHHRE